MSNIEVVRRMVDAFNRHDAAAFSGAYAPEAVVHDPYYPEPLRGRDAIQKDMEDFLRAFPDINVAVRVMLEGDGGVVATQASMRGTHRGPLPLPAGEFPATGRVLQSEGGHFSRLNSHGQIVEEHRFYDVLGQMVQLGLMPAEVAVS